jgi:hypothetical protein
MLLKSPITPSSNRLEAAFTHESIMPSPPDTSSNGCYRYQYSGGDRYRSNAQSGNSRNVLRGGNVNVYRPKDSEGSSKSKDRKKSKEKDDKSEKKSKEKKKSHHHQHSHPNCRGEVYFYFSSRRHR